MEEVLKALGPWPALQGVVFGLMVAGAGVWAMRKGLLQEKHVESLEEIKSQWAAYDQLKDIHENSFRTVRSLEQILETMRSVNSAVNRISDTRWNNRQ